MTQLKRKTTNLEPQQPPPPPKNDVYHIGGIPVEFPYKPYGTQLAFMGRVISTLDRAHLNGHCHALLESPTGTGKSLSLLCSALAWQCHRRHHPPKPDPIDDPLRHGGGFIADDSQLSETLTPDAPTNDNGQKKKAVPTIFYASRTHSQISQVIREYRKTTYRVPMAVLAARKHYCTNAAVSKTNNIDEECKSLLKDKENGCPHFRNAHRVKCHPSVQKGGCNEVHDIEDLVKVGKTVRGCSYFAARAMADDAHIVFCPYSYIINPVIRRAMEVNIKGAILILDEAHNIEDMSRDAGSVDIDEEALRKLQTELGLLCATDSLTYQPLHEMVQDILSWMERRNSSLEKRDFQHYFSCWTGDKAVRELQEANITQQCFPILQECAVKAIKAVSDTEDSGLPHLSGISAMSLEGLFCSLGYFFQGNGINIHDYQLVVQRFFKKPTANSSGGWTLSFSLWCLNPAVVFRGISELSMSVILTSGTLSPMNSFSSELGVPFGTVLEAPHVIDVESQVWASVVSTGPQHYPLNASYKTADTFAFQDAIGKSLEDLFTVIPGGSLVFFPSYKLMDKLCKRWQETGQWSRLNARKPLFVEPRGGNQEDLETELTGYYCSIHGENKPTLGKRRKAKKVDSNVCNTTNSKDIHGAAFLAVCRGKVSEGIDFSDDNARAVIIVGIPFPNINDIQVAEKKRYNDNYKLAKNLLGGSDWYCHQAFRALNQAAGRCIRHSKDYGAVIFLDERFREKRNMIHISKWLRKAVRTYDNFETSVEELQSFFCKIKARVEKSCLPPKSEFDVENIPPDNSVNRYQNQESQKLTISEPGEKRKLLGNMPLTTDRLSHFASLQPNNCSSGFRSESTSDFQEPSLAHSEDMDSLNEINTNFNNREESRTCGTPCMVYPDDELDISVVKETPMAGNNTIASPEASWIDDNLHSTMVQNSTEFQRVTYQSSTSVFQSPSVTTCSEVTPEKNVRERNQGLATETELSANWSVNSHAEKRRAMVNPTGLNIMQEMKFDTTTTENTHDYRSMRHSAENGTLVPRSKLPASVHQSKCKLDALPPSVANLGANSMSDSFNLDQRLQICCSLCKNPLGRAENNLYVPCSLTLLSKGFLTSLEKWKGQQFMQTAPTVLQVLIVDHLSVDQRLCNSNHRETPGQGIWCREDGCVYNTIFCPFCSSPDHCLGVQIMATDASNFYLINKILFYYDRLLLKISQGQVSKDLSDGKGSSPTQTLDINSISKYAYQSPQSNSGGWRTTKTKAKLQKRNTVSQF